MNILLITQEYPADDLEKEFTPVVHFFAKEWVDMGHRVAVINMPTNFPSFYYIIARPFRRKIESALGINIRMYTITKREYTMDSVCVLRYPLHKYKPHGRFPSNEINKGIEYSNDFCNTNDFQPDVIIGHWTNPVVEVMLGLKKCFNVPTALVMHDSGFDFRGIYKNEYKQMFEQIDIWGFRSYPLKFQFERYFGEQKKTFMCFSGVPNQYIQDLMTREFDGIRHFLYVGLLLKRKHPFELLKALEASSIIDFKLDIVGQGDERNSIENYIKEHPALESKVKLCGRIPRDEVSRKMSEADVFCMVSEFETYGLVYIEAMAAGCITIASRNEGFDGIIIDGYNGFLCEAGNTNELTSIINKIKGMSSVELRKISANAIKTAQGMTDFEMAKKYIYHIKNFIK